MTEKKTVPMYLIYGNFEAEFTDFNLADMILVNKRLDSDRYDLADGFIRLNSLKFNKIQKKI